jgi:hypothetical protein
MHNQVTKNKYGIKIVLQFKRKRCWKLRIGFIGLASINIRLPCQIISNEESAGQQPVLIWVNTGFVGKRKNLV